MFFLFLHDYVINDVIIPILQSKIIITDFFPYKGKNIKRMEKSKRKKPNKENKKTEEKSL